jgi:hypothetical protein
LNGIGHFHHGFISDIYPILRKPSRLSILSRTKPFVEKIQNRYVDHLSRDKIEIVCDHAIRHKEATGKTLDDFKIHELACEIQKKENAHRSENTQQTMEANAQGKVLEHREQVRQIKEAMKTLVLQQQLQQAQQRMLQQERGRGLGL